jgi:hypothetical protein
VLEGVEAAESKLHIFGLKGEMIIGNKTSSLRVSKMSRKK